VAELLVCRRFDIFRRFSWLRSINLNVRILLTTLMCSSLVGCATFSHRPVAENVVRCREQCQAGLEASRRGHAGQAYEQFAEAVKSCPADERARRLHAEALWEQGETTRAIDEMLEASRLSGGDPAMLVRVGEMYLASGSANRAAQYATAAIGAAPQMAEAWALEGDVLRQREDYAGALSRYHRALSYRSDFPTVQFAVSEIYLQQGRHSRALATLAALSQQYEADATPQRLFVLRATCLKSLNRPHEAADQLELAARAAPATPDLLFELADCRCRCGQPDAARLAAEHALALEPAHEGSRRLLAQLDRARDAGPTPHRY
jgi:tetratricopeptide (TPR) repeat protein